MHKLEVEFKFAIGDIVYFKDALHTLDHTPIPHIVVEQVAQRYSGGIQISYALSTNRSQLIDEICLASEPPPFVPESSERTKERIRVVRDEYSDLGQLAKLMAGLKGKDTDGPQ